MATAITIGVGIMLASLVIMWIILIRAPTGYEDDTGFHFGEPDDAR